MNSRNDSFSSTHESPPHRILIIGCAFGGITALVNLIDYAAGTGRPLYHPGPNFQGAKSERGVIITVVDERDGYFYAVGAPLAHVSSSHTTSMYKRFSHICELQHPQVNFLQGRVTELNMQDRIATWVDRNDETKNLEYDYVVVATGLRRSWPAVPLSMDYKGYLQDSQALIRRITGDQNSSSNTETPSKQPRKIVVIGAGAVGIEFAGEIKSNYPWLDVVLIHSRKSVLSSEPLSDDVKQRVGLLIEEEGIELITGERATVTEPISETERYRVRLSSSGTEIEADLVIDATKKGSATTNFLPKSYLNDDEEIKVESNLSFDGLASNTERHFGAGDVIAWSGIKRAGSAMVMGQTAATNIWASILNSERKKDTAEGAVFEHSRLEAWPAVIGIAIGKQCLTYDPENGIKYGEECLKNYFGDDLGWSGTLKYLKLTDLEEEDIVEAASSVEKLDVVDRGSSEVVAEA